MWWVDDRLDLEQLPKRRLVLEFRFPDRTEQCWILCDDGGPSVCTHDPGFGIDAVIEADLGTLSGVWLGRLRLASAIRSGDIRLQGSPSVVRRLPRALELSPMANTAGAVETRSGPAADPLAEEGAGRKTAMCDHAHTASAPAPTKSGKDRSLLPW